MRVIVAGAVAWNSEVPIRRHLASLPHETVVMHGDCEGADALAGEVARSLGLKSERWTTSAADISKHGKHHAWKGLNERMVASGANLVMVFHEGLDDPAQAQGTRHLIDLASTAGIEVRRHLTP